MSNTLPPWRESLSRIANKISQYGRRLLQEFRSSAHETYCFMRRGAALGRTYFLKLKFLGAIFLAELSLGEGALRVEEGDEGLRREFSGKAGRHGWKRISLLRRLAQDVKHKPVTAEIAAKLQHLRDCEASLAITESNLRQQRGGLFRTEAITFRRVIAGGLFVGLTMLVSLSWLRTGPNSTSELVANAKGADAAGKQEPPSSPPVQRPATDKNDRVGSSEPPRKSFALPNQADRPPVLQDVVQEVTGTTSEHYLESGFKEFRFGMSQAEVQALADRNKIPAGEGGQRFYFENGELIGYERLYSGDNAEYMRKFRELFGGALKENMTDAVGVHQGSTSDYRGNSIATAARNESLLCRYYFPSTLAYLQATWGSSAQGNINSVFRQEYLVLNVFDRRWVNEGLKVHAAQCRDVFERIRAVTEDEQDGRFRLSDLPTFLGAVRKYDPPKPDANLEVVRLMNAKGEPFVVVERALKDLPERPRGSVNIGIHLPVGPDQSNPLFKYTYPALEADRCDLIVAQEVFPPRGTTIGTERMRDSHQTTYSWQTASGWKVRVGPGGHIFLANVPEKQL